MDIFFLQGKKRKKNSFRKYNKMAYSWDNRVNFIVKFLYGQYNINLLLGRVTEFFKNYLL